MRARLNRRYNVTIRGVRIEAPEGHIVMGEMARRAVEEGAATPIREPEDVKPAGPTEAK